MKTVRSALAFLAALFITSCGGGSSSVAPGVAAGTGSSAQQNGATGQIVLSIPTQTPSGAVRYPQFVSPNASSVTIVVNGGTAQVFDVSATSSLCATAGGARSCTLTFGAPVGSDTIVLTIFAGANGTGTMLATTTTTAAVTAGTPFSVTVAVTASIGTVVATVTPGTGGNCNVGGGTTARITEGCGGGGATLTVTAFDPSGAQITGTAPYATPIVLGTSPDPSLSASPTSITAPGQSVALSYNSAPIAQSLGNTATFTLNIGNQAVPVSVPILRANLYVANSNCPVPCSSGPPGGGNVVVYPFGASGNATPTRTITSGLSNPVALVLDASGNLYVLDNGPYNSGSRNPSIVQYSPGATSPLKTVATLGANDSNSACEDIIFDPTAKFFFVTCDDLAIHVISLSTGTQTARLTFSSFRRPIGEAFDPSGNLWVAELSNNDIFEFAAANVPTSGNVALTALLVIQGPPAQNFWPSSIAPVVPVFDVSGTLYVNLTSTSNPTNARIGIWSSIANVAPARTLSQGVLDTPSPTGIGLDYGGNLYVSNQVSNQILVFSQATVAAGGTSPTVLRTLNTGSSPSAPGGMAIGP